jgi:hypothetical protein
MDDHALLLSLLERASLDDGLGPAVMAEKTLSGRSLVNPRSKVLQVMRRLETEGWVHRSASGRWQIGAHNEPAIVGNPRLVDRLFATFNSCRERGCDKDHLPDFIFSDFWFESVQAGVYGGVVARILASLLARESLSFPNGFPDKELDLATKVAIAGVSQQGHGDLGPMIRKSFSSLGALPLHGSLEDRVDQLTHWFIQDQRRLKLFLSAMDAGLIRATVMCSPSALRHVYESGVLTPEDVPLLPEAEQKKLQGIQPGGRDFKDVPLHERVGRLAALLFSTFLLQDLRRHSRAQSRASEIGLDARLEEDLAGGSPSIKGSIKVRPLTPTQESDQGT